MDDFIHASARTPVSLRPCVRPPSQQRRLSPLPLSLLPGEVPPRSGAWLPSLIASVGVVLVRALSTNQFSVYD
jgi:hypothetical protein